MVYTRLRQLSGTPLLLLLFVAAVALGGCSDPTEDLLVPEATTLFWHDWQHEDAVLLHEIVGKYAQFNPAENVVEKAIAPNAMYKQFVTRFQGGTEPNLVLVDARTAQELIRGGYVKELGALGVDPSTYNAAAMSMVRDGDKFYGLPFTMSTQLLFYDKTSIPEPPTTLVELGALVSKPQIELGLNTNFEDAFWGIRLFGGRAYDAEGNLSIDRGAFTNWLTVLKNTQAAAGFVLSNDQAQLRDAFIKGNLDLYIGSARDINLLQQGLGDRLGMAKLPGSRTGNPAGPLMQSTVLMISSNADEGETQRALELARFLTNSQQQGAFTQGLVGRLPANNAVRITPSMPPLVVELSKQVRSAVPVTLSQRPVWDEIAARSQTLYRSVLEGAVSVHEGVDSLETTLQAVLGRPGSAPAEAFACPTLSTSAPLTLTVWHGWSVPETAVLQEMAADFHARCPQVAFVTSQVPDNWELNTRYKESVAAGAGPDILLDSTQWTTKLAQAGLIRSLNDQLDPARMSQFVPRTVDALRYKGQMYGYPLAARSVALIYNPTLVPDPPQTLDDLLLLVDHEHQLAMPLGFFYGAWGLGAFGATVFDDNMQAVLDQGGMAEWLQWLHDAADLPGFVFTDGRKPAEELFARREAAFLISGPWSLPYLLDNMPADEIAVTMLPSGPVGLANPLLEVEALMFNPQAGKDQVLAGLAFARYLSGTEGAARLLRTGVYIPANVIVDTTGLPVIDAFRQQAQAAEAAHQGVEWDVLFAQGDGLFKETVLGDRDPAEAVQAFTQIVNETNAALNSADPAAAGEPVGTSKNQ